ncbi:Ly-6/neurotoxin-like protein 1 [Microtus ochrogaster]|uniref:Ly-6/neurotoxin-like protein 1 n=2 Tax=Microtus ochrogaster TaxID=79684 RepID=A0A8J6L3U4_MICOH|nr:Ly-6/neurotoxin-like protein 1 [Microtus ochrogaster]
MAYSVLKYANQGPDRPYTGTQALKCHECSTTTGNCYNPRSCSDKSRYCLTTWYAPPGQQTLITRTCGFTCPDVLQNQNNSKASCCNTDLCNSALSLHASWVLLILSVCFIYLSR